MSIFSLRTSAATGVPPQTLLRASLNLQCPNTAYLDDANLVGHVESVIVGSKADVRLLGAIRADEGVDLRALDVVHALDGILDLLLVSPISKKRDGRRGDGQSVDVHDIKLRALRRQNTAKTRVPRLVNTPPLTALRRTQGSIRRMTHSTSCVYSDGGD